VTRHECPTCGDGFDTRRGLGVHHSHVHGENLPNRTCDNCGREFYCEYEKRYCSEDCRDVSTSFSGRDNPNYRDRKERTECEICGDEFEYYPSDKEGSYCPDCVETESWRDPPTLSGPDNPQWSEPRQDDCGVCGERIERRPSGFGGTVAVCSEECRRKLLSELFSGPGHPNWSGGGVDAYGTGWNETRRSALERDDYACVICSTSGSELGRNPDVHHIVPVRAFAESDRHDIEDAHFLDNVVSLCPSCHSEAESGTISRPRLRYLIGAL
jgi:hypothetical protein